MVRAGVKTCCSVQAFLEFDRERWEEEQMGVGLPKHWLRLVARALQLVSKTRLRLDETQLKDGN